MIYAEKEYPLLASIPITYGHKSCMSGSVLLNGGGFPMHTN
ncbi:hypothetical protein [Treponema vincentii]|nr:hypothetical protein [Treponema vincentii]